MNILDFAAFVSDQPLTCWLTGIDYSLCLFMSSAPDWAGDLVIPVEQALQLSQYFAIIIQTVQDSQLKIFKSSQTRDKFRLNISLTPLANVLAHGKFELGQVRREVQGPSCIYSNRYVDIALY